MLRQWLETTVEGYGLQIVNITESASEASSLISTVDLRVCFSKTISQHEYLL